MERFVSKMVRGSLALGERCRCVVPSLSFPKYHLTLNTLRLDPSLILHFHARKIVVPDGTRVVPLVRIGDSPLTFGSTNITET